MKTDMVLKSHTLYLLRRKVCFKNSFILEILKHLSVSGTSKSWHYSCPQGLQAHAGETDFNQRNTKVNRIFHHEKYHTKNDAVMA